MSHDNFESANTIAQRLATDISDKLNLMKTLSQNADQLLDTNLSSFTASEKAIQDNKQVQLEKFYSIEGKLNNDKNSIDNSFSPINAFNSLINDFKSNTISDIKSKDSTVNSTLENNDSLIQSSIGSRLRSNTLTRYGLMKSQIEGYISTTESNIVLDASLSN